MSVKVLKQVPLTVALQAIHAVHTQRHLTVRNIHIANTGNVDATVRVCLSRTGVAAQASSALVWDYAVAGNDFLEFGEGLIIPPDWVIEAAAGAADSLVITVSGTED